MATMKEDNPRIPSQSGDHRFSTSLWGFQKRAVDSFVLRVAADYQLLLDAHSHVAALSAQLSPQGVESAIEAANNLLHSAEELAKSIRRQGREEAAGIRTEATAEARATKNDANQMAIVL